MTIRTKESDQMKDLVAKKYPSLVIWDSFWVGKDETIKCHEELAHEKKILTDTDIKTIMFPDSFKCNFTSQGKIKYDVNDVGSFDLDDNFSSSKSKSGKSIKIDLKTSGTVGECVTVGKRIVPSVLVCRVF